MGNPPYSIGQDSANDDNQNLSYPSLDERIRETYGKGSKATLQRGLYDPYIRSIRWASDRLCRFHFNPAADGKNPCAKHCQCSGIIGFVTNAGFLEVNTADGLRKCLADEFSNIYVFHLRGNQRTSGERSRQEGGKIFGSGSRAPIAITLLVKNPEAKMHGQIFWHDIGDYLSQKEKLDIITNFGSVTGITNSKSWKLVTPDKYHDWVDQRDESSNDFISIGSSKLASGIFSQASPGVVTSRDNWVYSFSLNSLNSNIRKTIAYFNAHTGREPGSSASDPTEISWSRSLKKQAEKGVSLSYDSECIRMSAYRAFTRQYMYYSRELNESPGRFDQFFPTGTTSNIVICVNGKGAKKGFTSIALNSIPDFNFLDAGAQCFPLYVYTRSEDPSSSDSDLFAANTGGKSAEYTRRDGISDAGLVHFGKAYPAKGEGSSITKEDLFYYIYGLLHSPDYRSRYADNLSKELPRIPAVKTYADFRAFEKAGRELAHWHLNYETVDCTPPSRSIPARS
jgi:predicted helicase